MDIILQYYNFSDFLSDTSNTFSGNKISYLALNTTHFLLFEVTQTQEYNLYVAKFESENAIGKNAPEILELLVKNYDKSIPEHRLALRAYLE